MHGHGPSWPTHDGPWDAPGGEVHDSARFLGGNHFGETPFRYAGTKC
jgi:hypothetical protein